MLRKTITAAAGAAAATAMLSAPATHAATGTTAIDITFPPLIILYYFDDIDITVEADDLEDLIINGNAALAGCTQGASGTDAELQCAAAETPKALGASGTVSTTTVTYDADITADANVSPAVTTDVTFVLENAWAVRALASSNLNASVALSGSGDFTNESITPTNPTASLTLTDGDTVGDVQFDVDIDSLTGLTASDTVTITVVSP